ncbi:MULTISPECIES: MipA/OmpV family protein [Duganella]|uniref:MipA/OmpV family protein n=1 Tax=Duganella TaxID=75654 RepID=UPI0030EAF747
MALLYASCAQAQETPPHVVGDLGLGVSVAPVAVPAQSRRGSAVPYANFDYAQFFARIDTFGVKLAPAGYGSLELLTRVLEDGYSGGTMPLAHRNSSLPLGLGTLQVTPVGALMVNLYRDLGKSRGTMLDLMYAAEIELDRFALYPQAGVEYRSDNYVRYYDGVPRSATNPYAALLIETHLSGRWYAIANLRRTWLDDAIRSNPLVRRRTLDAGLLALSYRFD